MNNLYSKATKPNDASYNFVNRNRTVLKKISSTVLLSFLMLTNIGNVCGQAVSSYTPTITSGTYTSVGTNGSEILGNVDDGNSGVVNIGFPFMMGGVTFTQFVANSNDVFLLNVSEIHSVIKTSSTPRVFISYSWNNITYEDLLTDIQKNLNE
jgi:hypothetical protein